jgi:excisionase family DNA binding protein
LRRAIPVSEVAELLAVDAITVRRLITRGELKAQKVGRLVRVFADSLDAYQRASEIQPGAQRPAQAKRVSRSHLDALARLSALGVR